MKLVICYFFVLLFSCTKEPGTPEAVLTQYVESRFDGKNIDDVSDQLTEEFKLKVGDSTNVEKEKFWKLNGLKKDKFKIVSSSCDQEECNITYYVSYFTMDSDKKDFLTETKKIAGMKKVDGKWKINDITHLKTFHDSLNDIDVKVE